MGIGSLIGGLWILLLIAVILIILFSIVKFSVDKSNLSKDIRSELKSVKNELREIKAMLEKKSDFFVLQLPPISERTNSSARHIHLPVWLGDELQKVDCGLVCGSSNPDGRSNLPEVILNISSQTHNFRHEHAFSYCFLHWEHEYLQRLKRAILSV
ncbi:hypothetical protein [Paenibacillus gorillae]|uniref:hypothetical protein n=1 Tax=Paenibacillus gorillae TaxID=1243662 RepID=UPI0005A7FA76|nr:hypothetical protein [Paenibacillus gorillae]